MIPPPTQAQLLDPTVTLRSQLPTDGEVRDAIRRVSKELDEQVQKEVVLGWQATGEFDFTLFRDSQGGTGMRGFLVIQRPD